MAEGGIHMELFLIYCRCAFLLFLGLTAAQITTPKVRKELAAFWADENKAFWRKTASIAWRTVRQYLICLIAVLIVEVLTNQLF